MCLTLLLFLQLWLILQYRQTLVSHRHVDRILYVNLLVERYLHVNASLNSWVLLQIVVQSVFLTASVLHKWPA